MLKRLSVFLNCSEKQYYQQSFEIYRLSRHKIRVPIDLPAVVFLNPMLNFENVI